MGRSSEFPCLEPQGLFASEILGDGNCLFNALSDQIYGDQTHHQEIRKAVISYMREHPDNFKNYITVEVGGGHRRNPKRKTTGAFNGPLTFTAATDEEIMRAYEAHLDRMAQGGTYGDNLEIIAFAQAFNTDIKIYKAEYAYYVRATDDGAERTVAHIAYHEWEHYSSIRNIDGPFTGLPNVKVKDLSPEEAAKVKAAAPKTIIQDWMIKSVMTSLPYLSFDESTIRKTLEDFKGNIDLAVNKLMDESQSSNPGSPGSYSQSGGSSIERDPDSDDDEIQGPNKRQNRRIKEMLKDKMIHEQKEAELAAIPTIELTQPDTVSELPMASQLPELSRLPAASQLPALSAIKIKLNTRNSKSDHDDNDFAPDDDEDDIGSIYSASSRAPSVSLGSTPPRHQSKPSKTSKTKQKQQGPRVSSRDQKVAKKAEQKQNRKLAKKATAQQTGRLDISTANNNKRSSPPMESMKTLYI